MNKDQVKGRVKQAKGKAREITGKITDDNRLRYQGKVEQQIGKVQVRYGDAKHTFDRSKNAGNQRAGKG